MLFLAEFLGLTIAYAAILVILMRYVIKWGWQEWEYLAAMTILTLFIALANPGAPLLITGIRHLPADVLSDTTQQQIKSSWVYFLHGNNPPEETSAAASAQPRRFWERTLKKAPRATPLEPTWFWWHAFLFYLLITFVYFFFAFWEELHAATKKAIEVLSKHREKHQKRLAAQQATAQPQQTARGQQPPAATTAPASQTPVATATSGRWWEEILKFVTVDIAMEALIASVERFFEHRQQRRRRTA
jgi:predicted PurR-regulated permease PerM